MATNSSIEWTECGRSVASNGYVLIRVGKSHPLADVRGYAYEHRLVASKKIGRWVISSEQVHHLNEIKTDNRSENLEVVSSIAEHRVFHRKGRRGLRMPGEPNVEVKCECGCGSGFLKYDANRRPRRFVSGHNGNNFGEFAEMLMWYLGNVPLPTSSQYIASCLGEDQERVSITLSRLSAVGKVERQGREWRLCG